MKAWWEGLSFRDRRISIIGGAVLTVLLLYALVWDPLHRGVAQLRDANGEQRAVLNWMQQSSQEVRALQGVARVDAAARGGESLLSLVDRTAKLGRLAGTLKKAQPEGDGKVQVWFEQAPFDELVPWLEQLSRQYGIQLENAQFERQLPGIVNARITLREPA